MEKKDYDIIKTVKNWVEEVKIVYKKDLEKTKENKKTV